MGARPKWPPRRDLDDVLCAGSKAPLHVTYHATSLTPATVALAEGSKVRGAHKDHWS
jgi:hypothetical protein